MSVCVSVCLSKTQPIIALPYYLSGPAAGVRILDPDPGRQALFSWTAAGSYERTSLLGVGSQSGPTGVCCCWVRTGRIPTKMVDVLLNCRKTTPKMMLHCRLGMPTLVHDDEDGDEKHVAGIPLDEGVTTADVACESGASTIGDLIFSLSLFSPLFHSLSLSVTFSHSLSLSVTGFPSAFISDTASTSAVFYLLKYVRKSSTVAFKKILTTIREEEDW